VTYREILLYWCFGVNTCDHVWIGSVDTEKLGISRR
jgi:hypothetical protein